VQADARRYAQRILEGRANLEVPTYRTLGLLSSGQAARVAALTGEEVSDFDFALDRSAVGHIQRKHDSEHSEAPRGQRAVTAADYARLPALLSAPDSIEEGGRSDVGRPVVVLRKRINGEWVIASFEVRQKRRMLALISMSVRP